jgi:hypothetical protein
MDIVPAGGPAKPRAGAPAAALHRYIQRSTLRPGVRAGECSQKIATQHERDVARAVPLNTSRPVLRFKAHTDYHLDGSLNEFQSSSICVN